VKPVVASQWLRRRCNDLAERSADATRQIAALVKAIQTDTHDAIGAMERSTQGVVEGAKLSDNAGTALD
jgi:twitching motility protein PilJ